MPKICHRPDIGGVRKGRASRSWQASLAAATVVILFMLVSVVHAGDWYVDGAVSSSGDGTSWSTAFKTINEGIVAAGAGDSINVAAGTYNERLVIDKQLTLTGAGWDTTIVQPLDAPAAGIYDVEIDASGTIIQGFQFDFNGSDDSRSGNGIVVSDLNDPPVTNVQILNNKIYTGHANTGIQTGKYSDVSGLIISGNIFYGDSDGMGEGVYINPYSGAGDVTIQNNEFYGYLYSGVSIEASNVLVTGNIINSDVTKGFYGVRFIDLTGGQSYSNVLISNNDIQNVQYGISIGTSTDVGSTLTATVYINTLTNNDVGIRVRYGANPTMIHNNILGNANYGISNEVTEVVVAERNWWGDPSGPYDPSDDILTGGWYNPGGTGDTVSDYVDYDPWSLEIHTDSGPLANFSADPLSGAPPLTVLFTDLSVGQITDYYWEFGDGQTSTEQNPAHQYQADGDYTVRLTVTGPEGSDMRGKVDYIHVAAAPPVADFSASPTSGAGPLSVTFTDQSTGSIDSWAWDFDNDGSTDSTEQSPSFTYNTPGTYTVALTVSGPGGGVIKEKIDYILVKPEPVADFSASPTSGVAPLSVTFTDQSVGTVTSWAWDFDNNGSTDSTAQNPLYTYNTPGTYTVTLTVTGPGGSDVRQSIDYIHASTSSLTADFSASATSGAAPLGVTFTDQSVGTVTSWAWDFDNNGSTDSTAQNPLYTYNTPGTYTVTLTVTGPGGSDVRQRTDYVEVSEVPPESEFDANPTSGTVPLSVQFIDLSIGPVTDWLWEFGDGETSAAQNPVHEYQSGGDYTVTLTVSGPGGSEAKGKVDYIHVGELPPKPDFIGDPLSGDAPLTVQFTDLSTGVISDWYWDFGDGETSTEQSPFHTYQVAGAYTVELTVTGPGGSEFRGKTDYIQVNDQPPVSDFSASPTSGMRPLRVDFTDLSTGVITNYYWEFGDGDVSTEQNPTHDYHLPGDYSVTLTVSGPGGSDIRGKIDYIHVDEAPPVADFMASPIIVARGTNVQFTDLSIGTIADYYWEFGDGDTSTEQHPSHAYQSEGYYTVRLTVTAPAGLDVRERIDYVYVSSGPVAEFVANPTSGTRPLTVQFTDLSMGSVTDYFWEFGDGQMSTEQNPFHQYQVEGDYTVRLTVSGPDGSYVRERVDHIHAGEETWWAKTYGSPGSFGNDRAQSVQPSADGGYIVAGWAAYSSDMWISKLNSDGTIRWQKAYDGTKGDYARSIQMTADGGCIVAGDTYSFGDGYHPDICLLKLDSDGNRAWQRTYGDIGSQRAYAIQETADGGYILAGESNPGNRYNFWVLKLNSNGTSVWQKTYSVGGGYDRAYAVRQTQDGGYVVCGESNFNFWILKLNSDGTVAWQKSYDEGGWNRARSIEQTADGGYIVTGEGDNSLWVLKLNADGTVAWQKTYGGGGYDAASSILQTPDGGYVVAGSTSSFGQGDYDVWVLKLNADGTIGWEKTYGGSDDDEAMQIRESGDGYILAGYTESFGDGYNNYPDIWVLSLAPNGEIPQCSAMTTSNAIVTDTTVDPEDSNALILETYLLPSITSIDPFDTLVETSTVCSAVPVSQADFVADVTSGFVPLFVQFTDQSTGTVTDWFWNFGDGETSTEQNPSHVYDEAGDYNVSLTIDGPDGIDIETKSHYIEVLHFADFSAGPLTGIAPLTVFFVDESSGNPTAWFWDFGDGKTSTKRNPTHTYYDIGYYTVSLTVTGPSGQDTITRTNYIYLTDYGAPVIEWLNPTSCEPKDRLRIRGYNFGDIQGGSVVHIGRATFDASSNRIKLWTNTRIVISVPNYKCVWFKGEPSRNRRVWVTVDSVDSNKKRLEVLKPAACP